MTRGNGSRGLRRIPPGYLYSFAAALIGITFIGMGLGAIRNGVRGVDPIDTLSGVGLAAFVLMYVPAFGVRLVFWRGASSGVRELVRLALIALFCAELAAALWALILLLTATDRHAVGWSGSDVVAPVFTVLGLFCQVGTIWWLIRYRGETGLPG